MFYFRQTEPLGYKLSIGITTWWIQMPLKKIDLLLGSTSAVRGKSLYVIVSPPTGLMVRQSLILILIMEGPCLITSFQKMYRESLIQNIRICSFYVMIATKVAPTLGFGSRPHQTQAGSAAWIILGSQQRYIDSTGATWCHRSGLLPPSSPFQKSKNEMACESNKGSSRYLQKYQEHVTNQRGEFQHFNCWSI